MNQPQWITLHFVQPMPLDDGSSVHNLTGYWEPIQGYPGYRLTKMVTKAFGHSLAHALPGGTLQRGTEVRIHQGTWLLSPQFVWMVEYEQETPIAGFFPEE